MSLISDKNPVKKNKTAINNCQLFDDKLIVYINEEDSLSISEVMKRGYKEMSKINLDIAAECTDDISDYEAWLCGVWFFKWRLC